MSIRAPAAMRNRAGAQTPATRRCSWRKLRQMNRRRCQMSWPCVEVAFILTPEPEPEHLNSARTSLVFEPQYLDRLDARRGGGTVGRPFPVRPGVRAPPE